MKLGKYKKKLIVLFPLLLLVSIIFIKEESLCKFINIFLIITVFVLGIRNNAISIINKELKLISERDFLTDTYNRRFMHLELLKACQNKEVITFLMVDIDDFKLYNDNYGHVQGDKILKVVSKALKDIFNEDVVCRYGGEEFSIISRLDEKETIENIKRFMKHLRELNIIHECSQVSDRITVSIGIEITRIINEEDIYNLVKEADEKLYLSKSLGKNTYTM
ncbi:MULTISPECIES: GGDEF domain-containing protein [unclassified Clostridium]|uniref:GGDEF domain-containing protein n=1 Tax=unclassified Clostridium TaxID=2614128 RepID=UPI003216327C